MPTFDLSRIPDAAIHVGDAAAAPARFAADELRRYVQVMTGRDVPVVAHGALGDAAVLVLSATAEPARAAPSAAGGFAIVPETRRLTVRGATARDLLDATYALLEQCGCRWSPYGAADEHVPRLAADGMLLREVRQAPRFAVRGYCSDIMTWHYTQPDLFVSRLNEDRSFIDWMGKSGANAFFYIRHPFDTQLTIPELLPDLARRGIAVEYGGHVLPLLLPRELFAQHPEYFPQSPQGERTDYGNLCSSSAAALELASAHAVQWVRECSEMRVAHLWGADLWKGGWCHCAACRGVTVQEQSLRVCNAVARALAEAGVARPVCYLAYHDTIAPDLRLRPEAGVTVEFAPRERCYGHALADPSCATNRPYAAALQRYAELFDGRVRVFEYYADAILFCGCAVPLTEVIERDLAYYHRLGVREITMLEFGTFSLWAYPLNFLAFARATASGTRPALPRELSAWRFGAHGEQVGAVLRELEDIMRGVVTYGDLMRPPRRPEAVAAVRDSMEAALPRLAALVAGLASDDTAVGAQAALLRYTHMLLQGVRRELEGDPGDSGPTRPGRESYEAALHVLGGVDRRFTGLWGAVDLPLIHAIHTMGHWHDQG
jgi:hypothetical protein